MMKIKNIDHIVVTVNDLKTSQHFYQEMLGLPLLANQSNDYLLTFNCGEQLLKLQKAERPTPLKAVQPTSGTADFCMITDEPVADVIRQLHSKSIKIIAGPVIKHGAQGAMTSVYFHDPDQNLLEIAVYDQK